MKLAYYFSHHDYIPALDALGYDLKEVALGMDSAEAFTPHPAANAETGVYDELFYTEVELTPELLLSALRSRSDPDDHYEVGRPQWEFPNWPGLRSATADEIAQLNAHLTEEFSEEAA